MRIYNPRKGKYEKYCEHKEKPWYEIKIEESQNRRKSEIEYYNDFSEFYDRLMWLGEHDEHAIGHELLGEKVIDTWFIN